jgi:hypothetical protein
MKNILLVAILFGAVLSFAFSLRLPQKSVALNSLESRKPSVTMLALRGGKKSTKKERIQSKMIAKAKSSAHYLSQAYNQMSPITKSYFTLALLCTVANVLGAPAPSWFSLNIVKFYEIWRPFTTIAFFGPPSISMANSLYLLARYGQVLEASYGSALFAWYIMTQVVILSLLGYALGFKFLAQPMITSMIYIASRMQPKEKM